jgi:tRNA pseudouridine55 synthase
MGTTRTPDLVPGKQQAADRPAPWESGLVIVDKPGGMTSHDVVARVRRLAHTRRVGHAGTLDPMATGILVIGIERATRLLGHLVLAEKTYVATIRLGQSTSTDDAEGEALPARWGAPPGSPDGAPDERKGSVPGVPVIRAADVPRGTLEAEIAKLTGEILQVPSSVSAIKVNGQRAYQLTRAGQTPELAARPVTVHEFLVTAVRGEGDFLDVDALVRCSSGTYIRALARDLGAALGTGGHLTALRRTAVGPYTLAQAHTLEELEDQNQSPERVRQTPTAQPSLRRPSPPVVIPLAAAAAAAFPRVDLTADEARRLAQGARLPLPPNWQFAPRPQLPNSAGTVPRATARDHPDVPLAAFDPDGTLVALVTMEDGRLRSLAVFVDAAARTRDT